MTRTPDLLITNQLLYRLSYTSINLKTTPRTKIRGVVGPSAEIRTRGLLNPIQARYQLRYTRILEP